MPLSNDVPTSSWLTAAGILLVAVFLGLWQWFDQKSRDPELNPEDRDFFRSQDLRRYLGVAVMAALALLLALGSSRALEERSPKLLTIVWLVVCGLIVVLLALALVDGLATQKYARRQHKALEQARTKLMLDVMGRTGAPGAGRPAADQKTEAPER